MAMSGGMVASDESGSHSGGINTGARGTVVAVEVGVFVAVKVGIGVVVGGTISCVTKLHDNRDKTSNPIKICFDFISPYFCYGHILCEASIGGRRKCRSR